MRIDFVRFSDAAICLTKGALLMWQALIFIPLKNVLVPSSAVKIILTDIGFKILRSYFGKIHSRSSFALIRFTDVSGRVIDSDYRGPVSLIFFNFSNR